MRQIGFTNYSARPIGFSSGAKPSHMATHGNKTVVKGK